MKRTYLNVTALGQALSGKAPLTKPVAYAYDEHNRPLVGFIATDKDTGALVKTKKGDIALNWKPQKAKTQAAGTASLGEVLSGDTAAAIEAAGAQPEGDLEGDVDNAPY